MGPSPTIPTSFVPKQPVRPSSRVARGGFNLFMAGSLFLLIVAAVAAAGVYAYGAYLKGVKESKAAELAQDEQGIDSDVVEEFVRSRDRFIIGKSLLDSHVATSGFFDLLERITLANVRYSSLKLLRLSDGSAEVSLEGTAKSFNALAAQSAAFSSEKLVKRTIFSDIKLETDGTVSFTLSAEADPRLFAFTANGAVPAPSNVQQAPAVPAAPAAPEAPPAAGTSSAATTTP